MIESVQIDDMLFLEKEKIVSLNNTKLRLKGS